MRTEPQHPSSDHQLQNWKLLEFPTAPLSNLEVSWTLSDLNSIDLSYYFDGDSNETTEDGGTRFLIHYLESIPEGAVTMGLAVSDDTEAIMLSANTLFSPSDLEKSQTDVL